ncbi:hypothetical protein JOF40_001080 [Aeromicrobium fastidiosum]|nr:hypothetical protein [Aeromicrobium fastidiosum]
MCYMRPESSTPPRQRSRVDVITIELVHGQKG